MRHIWELCSIAASVLLWWAAEWAGVKLFALGVLAIGWVWYFVHRGRRPGAWHAWGFRVDNWRDAAKWHGGAAAGVVAAMAAFGAWQGNLGTPLGVILLVYPVWAIGQQFILQHVVIGAARELRVPEAWLPLIGAVGFAIAHAPDVPLMLLTAMGGALWTALFMRVQNLWTLGLGHAIVGALAFGWVLGRDPVAEFPMLAALG